MIVKPTVNELLEHAENRYALVIATSRRARQIANGDEALTKEDEPSPVTLAAKEINIYSPEQKDEEENEIDEEKNENEE